MQWLATVELFVILSPIPNCIPHPEESEHVFPQSGIGKSTLAAFWAGKIVNSFLSFFVCNFWPDRYSCAWKRWR